MSLEGEGGDAVPIPSEPEASIVIKAPPPRPPSPPAVLPLPPSPPPQRWRAPPQTLRGDKPPHLPDRINPDLVEAVVDVLLRDYGGFVQTNGWM